MFEYNTELNSSYMTSKFNTQTSLLDTLTGGATASVVDFGVSVYNSLPYTEETTTADVLSSISDNALNVYNEHTDTIEAISFIGGSFVPGAVALKGMNALRAGAKGVSWFSNVGKVESLKKAEEAFSAGVDGTKAYRAARNTIYRNGVMNNMVDAAAMEVMVLGTMNAHPFLEDYWENPVKNFGISLAFGSLGAVGGAIADSFVLKGITGKIETEAFNEIGSVIKSTSSAMPDVGRLQAGEAVVKALETITSKDYNANGFTKEAAQNILLARKAGNKEAFDKLIGEDIRGLDTETLALMQDKIANDTRLAGANKIKFYTESEVEASKPSFANKIGKALQEVFTPTKVIDDATKEVTAINDVVYLQEFDKFADVEEAQYYLRANALGHSPSTYSRKPSKDFGLAPDVDARLTLDNSSTAKVDSLYLDALTKVNSLSPKEVANLSIASDDVFMMNAVIARVKKEPEAFADLKVRVTNERPKYASDIVPESVKVNKEALALQAQWADAASPYNLLNEKSSISEEAKDMLGRWVSGGASDKMQLRTAIDEATRGNVHTDLGRLGKEILDSKESKALLSKLSLTADKDGFVHMYRGIMGKQVGHSPIESYTPSIEVARRFGTPKLYKISVNDVIGAVTQPGSLREFEYLVGSPARPSMVLDDSGNVVVKGLNKGNDFKSAEEVEEMLYSQKEALISSMLEKGIPFETISIKANVPIETVTGFATRLGQGEGFADLLTMADYKFNSYDDASRIGEYLAPTKRPLRIQSDVNKLKFSQLASGLDSKLGLNVNLEYLDVVGKTSASTTMRDFNAMFFGDEVTQGMRPVLDMIRSSVGEFNNSKLGNSFINSADFFLRNTGIGPAVTLIGKNIQTVATKATVAITKPLTERMATVAKNELALIEANTAMSVNASLKGYRYYKDGYLFNRIEEEGKSVDKIAQFNGKDFRITTPEVQELMKSLEASGRELFELKNSINKTLGKAPMNDIGFWVPAFNPRDKFIAYVWDKNNNSTKLLWGRSANELSDNIAAYRKGMKEGSSEEIASNLTIATKQEQALYNDLNNRLDPLTMRIANVENFKTGSSSSAIVKNNTDIFGEIIGGYENYIESHTKSLGSIMMHDTLDVLDSISGYNKRLTDNQPLGAVMQDLNQPKDGAQAVKNILLGNTNLNTNQFWKKHTENIETVTNWGLNTISKVVAGALDPAISLIKNKTLDADALTKIDYERIEKELTKAGIVNPWAEFDKAAAVEVFKTASLPDATNISRRMVYASNAFAATFALRVLDLAQPMVNMMSLPILTSLAKAQDHPTTFMSAQKSTAKVSTAQILHEGVRLNNSKEGERWASLWEKSGYFDSYVSEANSVLRESRKFQSGAIPKIENALGSKLIETLSFAADKTESILRRQTMFTGAVLAKRLYPELDDLGVTVFARDFMDRSMGNYHSSQRPVFFQGTLGTAMGLFQTYMLTMGQNLYRHLELKNYKAIGKAAMLQSGIFGTQSLPGFDMVSQSIGDHYSDENIDLTTGTFRALDNDVASAVLYGLPSSLGPAFYTRGSLDPRVVNPLSSGEGFAAVSMVSQTLSTGANIIKAVSSESEDAPRAIGQALALQSVSRPLARVSEIFTGYSVTKAGNTVATPEEVWSFSGLASRALSTRPTEEAVVRDMMHLNTVYGQLDREARQKVTYDLKLSIREGTLTDSKLAEMAHEYMRKDGTSRGWQAAVNKAIAEVNTEGKAQLVAKLKPDNPLMHMINSLD
jgi:hypothetical protein